MSITWKLTITLAWLALGAWHCWTLRRELRDRGNVPAGAIYWLYPLVLAAGTTVLTWCLL